MTSMRKIRKRYLRWNRWAAKLPPDTVVPAGWERIHNRWAAAIHRREFAKLHRPFTDPEWGCPNGLPVGHCGDDPDCTHPPCRPRN